MGLRDLVRRRQRDNTRARFLRNLIGNYDEPLSELAEKSTHRKWKERDERGRLTILRASLKEKKLLSVIRRKET